jgi:prevent-host-death family protein
MRSVNVHEATTHFPRLLLCVEQGEELVITRDGRPVARLVPVGASHCTPVLGGDRGKFEVPDDFDAPLPEDTLASFEGRSRRT